jgi:hypothetical protein
LINFVQFPARTRLFLLSKILGSIKPLTQRLLETLSPGFKRPCCEAEHQTLSVGELNPLNAELNPICHLLILLGYSTFMGPCIVSISNKMQRRTVYLYLETALHVSGGTSTHHQKRIQLYLQHLVFVTPLLLSAAILEELEPV